MKGKIERCVDKEPVIVAQEGGNSISEERQQKRHDHQNSSYGYGGRISWDEERVSTGFANFD